MEKRVIFFSSDARKVYKDDIYRVLSLPDSYVIEFRYSYRHIADEIKTNLDSMKNETALIFHSYDSNTKFKSVREVVIKDIKKESDMVFFYLSLKGFVDYDLEEIMETEKLSKFVDILNVKNKNRDNFYTIVDNLTDSFKDNVFFNIREVCDKKGKALISKYDEVIKESYYEIEEENGYSINIEFYNFDSNEDSFKIESAITEMNIPQNRIISLDGNRNIEKIKILTKSINIKEIDGCLNFCNYNLDDNKEKSRIVPINIRIKRKTNRAISIAIGTTMASLAIFSGQYISRQNIVWYYLLIPSLISGFSAYYLYEKLNKK